MLTPAQVRNHQFSASGRGTYRASEVDDFFASVCESYEQMFRENGELLKKIGLLADKVEEYKSDEDNIREALLTAQRMANKIISDAKAEAEKKLSDAEQKAQQADPLCGGVHHRVIPRFADKVYGLSQLVNGNYQNNVKNGHETPVQPSEAQPVMRPPFVFTSHGMLLVFQIREGNPCPVHKYIVSKAGV